MVNLEKLYTSMDLTRIRTLLFCVMTLLKCVFDTKRPLTLDSHHPQGTKNTHTADY